MQECAETSKMLVGLINSGNRYHVGRELRMAQKRFTEEEIALLMLSPYVASVSETRVQFTPEFKRMAYHEMSSGKTLRTVMEENEISSDILGDSRIWSIAANWRKYAEREEGFEDLRSRNGRKTKKQVKEQTMEERVAQLEHELKYAKQELDFLKKIQAADMEARKAFKSKHSRK